MTHIIISISMNDWLMQVEIEIDQKLTIDILNDETNLEWSSELSTSKKNLFRIDDLTYQSEVFGHLKVDEFLHALRIACVACDCCVLRGSHLFLLHGLAHSTIRHLFFFNVSHSINKLKKIFETIILQLKSQNKNNCLLKQWWRERILQNLMSEWDDNWWHFFSWRSAHCISLNFGLPYPFLPAFDDIPQNRQTAQQYIPWSIRSSWRTCDSYECYPCQAAAWTGFTGRPKNAFHSAESL